jgi:hypothetical protein
MTRRHVRSIVAGACDTSTTVVPSSICEMMRRKHLRWNASSPHGEHLVDQQDVGA